MVVKKIKNFFWPNKGIVGAYAVWIILFFVNISTSYDLLYRAMFESPALILWTFVVNFVVLYLFSCISIWAYEKLKKK
jgi:hypothetical protein